MGSPWNVVQVRILWHLPVCPFASGFTIRNLRREIQNEICLYRSCFVASAAMVPPMESDEVAAGDGALQT